MIKLNKNFYTRAAVEKAAEDYRDSCFINIEESVFFEIKITPKEITDVENLELEFCNYCLNLMR